MTGNYQQLTYEQRCQISALRRKEASKPTKMTPKMIAVIESKLRIEWSPEQISGWLLDEQEILISHESIYLHIWADKRAGGLFIRIFGARARSMINVVTVNRREVR